MSDDTDKPGQLPDELRRKPGGGRWRQCELQAARLRAEGHSWESVAKRSKYTKKTLRQYTGRTWWQPLYDYYVQQVAVEKAQMRHRQADQQERDFREREGRLVQQGTLLALSTLIAGMRGEPPRDSSGAPIGNWPTGSNGEPKPPSWQTRVLAAGQFLKAAGYEEAKKQLARLSVGAIEKANEELDDIDAVEVDLTITGLGGGGGE